MNAARKVTAHLSGFATNRDFPFQLHAINVLPCRFT